MRFQREPIALLWTEVMPLLAAHYREVAHFQDIPLDPDQAFYENSEAVGIFRAYTARDEFGKLVGYAAYFVLPNPHYRSLKQAVGDVVYVTPKHRGHLVGFRMLKWCHEQLTAEGCETATQHVKTVPGLDFSPLLQGMGYEVVEKLLVKRLQVIPRECAA
jgi:GNAT superfamily N-acetyltransferase